MNKNNNRMARIEQEMKRELSNIINYELVNSNITGMVSVTKVKVSPDLSRAIVYVTMYNSNKKNTLAGLKNASGYIRHEIAQRINLRVTPELIFEFDDSLEYGAKIDGILSEIMKDVKTNEGENK